MKTLGFLVLAAVSLPVVAQIRAEANGNAATVGGDIRIDANAGNVTTISSGGNDASVTIGGIGDGVSTQGVTIINGKVWIDGEAISPGVTRHKAKSGVVYRIERKNGAVSVTSE